jgi:hypothetical protein
LKKKKKKKMEESRGEEEKIEESVGSVLEEAKELQDSISAHISKTLSDEQPLRQRSLLLDSKIHSLRSSLDSLLSNKLINPSLADKVVIFYSLSLFVFDSSIHLIDN